MTASKHKIYRHDTVFIIIRRITPWVFINLLSLSLLVFLVTSKSIYKGFLWIYCHIVDVAPFFNQLCHVGVLTQIFALKGGGIRRLYFAIICIHDKMTADRLGYSCTVKREEVRGSSLEEHVIWLFIFQTANLVLLQSASCVVSKSGKNGCLWGQFVQSCFRHRMTWSTKSNLITLVCL